MQACEDPSVNGPTEMVEDSNSKAVILQETCKSFDVGGDAAPRRCHWTDEDDVEI
jgi:hypothetical protein